MKSPELIDRDQLLNRCLNDVDFTLQMLAVFCEAAPRTAKQLEAAIAEGALTDAKRHAHTLKGSAANLAIEDLRLQAARLELLADERDLDALSSASAEIMRCVRESVHAATELSASLERK
jgi:HPt (histidine-containing phosphotransfer) domain-containing protein